MADREEAIENILKNIKLHINPVDAYEHGYVNGLSDALKALGVPTEHIAPPYYLYGDTK